MWCLSPFINVAKNVYERSVDTGCKSKFNCCSHCNYLYLTEVPLKTSAWLFESGVNFSGVSSCITVAYFRSILLCSEPIKPGNGHKYQTLNWVDNPSTAEVCYVRTFDFLKVKASYQNQNNYKKKTTGSNQYCDRSLLPYACIN